MSSTARTRDGEEDECGVGEPRELHENASVAQNDATINSQDASTAREENSWEVTIPPKIFVSDAPVEGHASCPCIAFGDLSPINQSDLTEIAWNSIGGSIDLSTYGFGCEAHDAVIDACINNDSDNNDHGEETPRWCNYQWCWVNPDFCTLRHNKAVSVVGKTRFYSYATCRSVDTLRNIHGVRSLVGRTLKVGFNHNTGGWVGAFSEKKKNFEGPIDIWSGPVLEFINAAAILGNFSIALTPPPPFFLNRSIALFGGSRFSYCVYATALGFLDLCVAQYTITAARGSTADWLVLGDQPLRIIVYQETTSTVSSLVEAIALTFRPFTAGAWYFIIFAVVPLLGGLMVLHDYGAPGSSYPEHHQVVVKNEQGQEESHVEKVPLYRHGVRSLYYSCLSVFKGVYESRVVTLGAYLNLMGISCFILLIFSVYTANLTAILTAEAQKSPIRTLQDVADRDLRICSIRTGYQTIQGLHGNVGKFVRDPVELGGDGKPGFNCPDCNVAQRVFDFLDPVKAKTDERYCHVAITQEQDLVVLHGKGQHCNKTAVGLPVARAQTGIPVYEGISRELTSFLIGLMHQGVYKKAQDLAKPQSQCPAGETTNTVGMPIIKLMGIWVVVIAFCSTGIIVMVIRKLFFRRNQEREKMIVSAYDQFGQQINRLHHRNPMPIEESIELMLKDGWRAVSKKKLAADPNMSKRELVSLRLSRRFSSRFFSDDNESSTDLRKENTWRKRRWREANGWERKSQDRAASQQRVSFDREDSLKRRKL